VESVIGNKAQLYGDLAVDYVSVNLSILCFCANQSLKKALVTKIFIDKVHTLETILGKNPLVLLAIRHNYMVI
jgi:hypothetical protein